MNQTVKCHEQVTLLMERGAQSLLVEQVHFSRQCRARRSVFIVYSTAVPELIGQGSPVFHSHYNAVAEAAGT